MEKQDHIQYWVQQSKDDWEAVNTLFHGNKNMVDRTTAIETAQAFINDCQATGLHFDKVLLFGSFANGMNHEGSDIDLLIVSNQFTDNIFENLKLYSKINIRYPIIETHPYSTLYFQKGDDFIQRIIDNSIEVV
jgi:predicted nucleotidyltransferase